MAQDNHQSRNTGYQGNSQDTPSHTINLKDSRFASLVDPELFAGIAEKKAAEIFKARDGRNGEKNRSTQLRKFYDELLMWHEKVHLEHSTQKKNDKFAEVVPYIKMMKAKVAYAFGRGHVDQRFKDLFSHLVDQITDVGSLKHAKLFLEAFMGFYKAQEK